MTKAKSTPAADASGPGARRSRRFLTPWNVARLLIASILVVELGLRVFGLGNPVLYTKEPGEAQGGCAYFLAPNQDTSRFFEHNKTNQWGMRCDNFPAQKDPGHYRVLFIGDSVTYGTTFVDQSEIFTSILQRELPAIAHQPVDVLNASAGGWAPANEINFLRSRGAYDADLVFFVFNTADLTQGFNAHPDSRSSPTTKPLTAIGEAWQRYLLPRIVAPVPADAGAVPEPVTELSNRCPLDSLGAALEYCRQVKTPGNPTRGTRLAILFSPAHGGDWDRPAYDTLKQNLAQWCAARAVPFVDLAPALPPPYDKVYFGDREFIHLRPAGHRLVADRIEQAWPDLTRPSGR